MPLFKKRSSGFDEENADDGGESMLQHFVNLESAGNNHETSHELAYKKLKQLFAPFVLRRRKKEVLSQIMYVSCKWTGWLLVHLSIICPHTLTFLSLRVF